MRKIVFAAATAVSLTLGAVAAQAMPTTVVIAPAVVPPVVQVGFCGFGFHLGAYGRCVRKGFVVRRVVSVVPVYGRACFTRLTPFGIRRVCR